MVRFCAGLLAAAALGFTFAPAAEEKKNAPKLSGAWVREAEGNSLTLDFQSKDKLVATVEANGNKFTVTCKYAADKEGVVKASVSEADGDAPNKPEKGFKFQFKIKVDGNKATVTDFEADNNPEGAKQLVEGDYKKKTDK